MVWVSEAGDLAHTCPTHPFLALLGPNVAGIVVRMFAMYVAGKTGAAYYVPGVERPIGIRRCICSATIAQVACRLPWCWRTVQTKKHSSFRLQR